MSSINELSSFTDTIGFSKLWRPKKIETNFGKTHEKKQEKQSPPLPSSSMINQNISTDKQILNGDCVVYIPELNVYRLPEYMNGAGTVVERPMALIAVHEKDIKQFHLDNEINLAKNINRQFAEFTDHINVKI